MGDDQILMSENQAMEDLSKADEFWSALDSLSDQLGYSSSTNVSETDTIEKKLNDVARRKYVENTTNIQVLQKAQLLYLTLMGVDAGKLYDNFLHKVQGKLENKLDILGKSETQIYELTQQKRSLEQSITNLAGTRVQFKQILDNAPNVMSEMDKAIRLKRQKQDYTPAEFNFLTADQYALGESQLRSRRDNLNMQYIRTQTQAQKLEHDIIRVGQQLDGIDKKIGYIDLNRKMMLGAIERINTEMAKTPEMVVYLVKEQAEMRRWMAGIQKEYSGFFRFVQDIAGTLEPYIQTLLSPQGITLPSSPGARSVNSAFDEAFKTTTEQLQTVADHRKSAADAYLNKYVNHL